MVVDAMRVRRTGRAFIVGAAALAVGSAALVVLTYGLLVELWRRILAEWGAGMAFGDAVRIWCVSNLGKYVPGKVWQIVAMGQLARRVPN